MESAVDFLRLWIGGFVGGALCMLLAYYAAGFAGAVRMKMQAGAPAQEDNRMVVNNRRIIGRGPRGGQMDPPRIHTRQDSGNPDALRSLSVEGRTSLHVELETDDQFWIGLGERDFWIHEPSRKDQSVRLRLVDGQPPRAMGIAETPLKAEPDTLDEIFATEVERFEIERQDKHTYRLAVNGREYRFFSTTGKGPGLRLLDKYPYRD